MPWLNDIATVLEAAGIGTYGVNIFLGMRASVPFLPSGMPVLTVIETGGTRPEGTQNSIITPAYLRPGAQLIARSINYDTARSMAEGAYLALFGVRNQFINSGWYQTIDALQEPFDMGVDEQGRTRIVFNVIGKASLGRVLP